jgi:hypothetical protein
MSNKFDDFYSKKPVSELIEKLLDHKVHSQSMDPTWYDALIIHLSKRDMSNEQRTLMDHILNSDAATLRKENARYENTPDSVSSSSKVEYATSSKYPALQMLSGVIAIIAWIIAVLTVVIVLALLSNLRGEGSWIFPVGTLALGAICCVALFAFSEVIKVFVDIEENTRQAAAK